MEKCDSLHPTPPASRLHLHLFPLSLFSAPILALMASIKVHIWLTAVVGGCSRARRLERVMQMKQMNVSFWGSDALFVSSHETI